jgi:hypothetical protein
MTEQYNGWTNHETRLANMWLNNEEYSYGVLCEALALPELASRAEWLEEQVRCALSKQTDAACLSSDLLNLSMGHINWLEIVENQD